MVHTDRLQLKWLENNDKESVLSLLINDVIKKTYMLPDFKDSLEAEKLFFRLKEYSHSNDHYIRGVYLDGALIGFLNDTEIENGSIELGWVIHPEYHNRGYGTEAVTKAIAELFNLGFAEVTAGAFEENRASIRVMEKCGMMPLKKTEEIEYRGSTHHCVFYSIRRAT